MDTDCNDLDEIEQYAQGLLASHESSDSGWVGFCSSIPKLLDYIQVLIQMNDRLLIDSDSLRNSLALFGLNPRAPTDMLAEAAVIMKVDYEETMASRGQIIMQFFDEEAKAKKLQAEVDTLKLHISSLQSQIESLNCVLDISRTR